MTNFTPQPTPAQDLRDLLGAVHETLAVDPPASAASSGSGAQLELGQLGHQRLVAGHRVVGQHLGPLEVQADVAARQPRASRKPWPP